MLNPVVHPSPLSIKKWAYQKSTSPTGASNIEATPEWNEAITTLEHADLLLALASDTQCPKRVLVLKCLYFLIGTSASKHVEADIAKVHALLNTVQSTSDQVILNWVARSRIILGDLRKFDYTQWCKGGFVEQDLPSA